MTYTCGYWRDANSLEQAQKAKLELICRKLKLEPGMRLLDIGCGWGSLMSYAAEKYAIECVGVTVSQAQVEWAEQRYSKMPLTFRLQDYRDLHGSFDRVVSVGMFEPVGRKNYGTFFDVARRCLKSCVFRSIRTAIPASFGQAFRCRPDKLIFASHDYLFT